MRRTAFLKNLVGSAAALLLSPTLPRPSVVLYEGFVAGFQYHAGPQHAARLWAGQPLTLHRESDNVHDERAIAVHHAVGRLGYVPHRDNRVLASLLDQGATLRARLTAFDADAPDWEQAQFIITML